MEDSNSIRIGCALQAPNCTVTSIHVNRGTNKAGHDDYLCDLLSASSLIMLISLLEDFYSKWKQCSKLGNKNHEAMLLQGYTDRYPPFSSSKPH